MVSLLRALVVWPLSRQRISLAPALGMWKHLIGDSGVLLIASIFLYITAQGDYIILGRMYPDQKEIVGQYFWAFNMSTQALQLLGINIASILLPSLAMIQDEHSRQRQGFVRAMRMLVLIAVPACLLQAALARPLVHLVLRPEWYGAVPIIQILSAGWAIFAVKYSSDSFLKAQGRFVAFLRLAALSAILFVVCVYIGARLNQGPGAAMGVAAYSAVIGPLSIYVALRPLGGSLRETVGVFAAPLLGGIIAFGGVAAAASVLPFVSTHPLGEILLILIVGFGIYLVLARWACRGTFDDLLERAKKLFNAPDSMDAVTTVSTPAPPAL
jgi:PST family polysaccharide transporter